MTSTTSQLDKLFTTTVSQDYGSITVRVVVLAKQKTQEPDEIPEVPGDLGEGEVLATVGKTPVSGYLEDAKRGSECCVFLINGQRQDAWDNTFIVRDLNMKYLRNRMLVSVDLDSLKPEAAAELMSGDRQGFFQGKVYGAMSARLMATLKKDPDLERLEEEAEQELTELRSGDAAVQQTLDQLIEEHHASADHPAAGADQPGTKGTRGEGAGADKSLDVIVGPQVDGTPVSGPYLVGKPGGSSLRLHPGETERLRISTEPVAAFAQTGPLHVQVTPTLEGLTFETDRNEEGATVSLKFEEPDEWEDDQYPVETALSVTATIKGFDDPRLLERRVVISRPKERKKRPAPVLSDDPKFLRVTSRQPVALLPGGADTHVRVRWDGKDELLDLGWRFEGKCLTHPDFPAVSFSRPILGRFELLLQSSYPSQPGETFRFEISAVGPGGKALRAEFAALSTAPQQPKKLKKIIPEPAAQRRPPYKLVYVNREGWDNGYQWTDTFQWTAEDVGCFDEPSDSRPLTLIINEDMNLLAVYKEELKKRKLEASTVKERVNRYTSHVAFHLYQMYLSFREIQKARDKDDQVKPPTDDVLRGEINRVGATLIKLMQVAK